MNIVCSNTLYPMFILVPFVFFVERLYRNSLEFQNLCAFISTYRMRVAAHRKPRSVVLSFCAFDDFLCISFSLCVYVSIYMCVCVCGNRIWRDGVVNTNWCYTSGFLPSPTLLLAMHLYHFTGFNLNFWLQFFNITTYTIVLIFFFNINMKWNNINLRVFYNINFNEISERTKMKRKLATFSYIIQQ